MGDHLWFVFFI